MLPPSPGACPPLVGCSGLLGITRDVPVLAPKQPLGHSSSPQLVFDDSHPWEPEADPRGLWHVQTGKIGEENDYGVVSDGYGFEDSPDCERISDGVNFEPDALAFVRKNRDRLFFPDTGGYRWFVDERANGDAG